MTRSNTSADYADYADFFFHYVLAASPLGLGTSRGFVTRLENYAVGLPATCRDDTAVLGRVQVLRFAPPLRAPSATWTRPPRGDVLAFMVAGRVSLCS